MQFVKDKNGQDWPVEITVGSIARIRAVSDGRFDLYRPEKDNLASTLADDLVTFWELLWFICEVEAKTRNVTAEQFGQGMADELLIDAQTKFLREWSDFFRRLAKPAQQTVIETAIKANQKALELVRAKLTTETRTAIDNAIDRKLTTTLNGSFGNLLELLELPTPAPTPSDILPGRRRRNKGTTAG